MSGLNRTAFRQLFLVLIAAVMALALVAAPPTARDVAAATPDLTLVTEARYEVQPDDKRVRVTVDIVARNRLKDTATRRFYFDRAFLAVQPGTSGFKLTAESGDPSVRVSDSKKTYQILSLSFGRRIYSGKTGRFRLTFDLPDPGGAPTRDVRIGSSLVSFPVWAYASEDTPGSTVTVSFPDDFNVAVEAGELPAPKTQDGRIVYSSGALDKPLSFFAYFVADRPGSYSSSAVRTQVGDRQAELTIRGWEDDADWSERVSALMDRGLPILHEQIGLPWEREGPLTVQESVSRTTGGYAGLFDPREGRIEVAYYADGFVILHEAAHAWFNGNLLADRWANEAFASYYASLVGEELEAPIPSQELTDELRDAAFPLNAWAPAGRGDPAAEDFGYAASVTLAREIAARAGEDGLREVWAAAAAREAAYQPPSVDPAGGAREAEPAEGPPDWRGLLDLLEDRTGRRYDDLWSTWVVRDGEADLLAERADARQAYTEVVRDAGRWELPASVRGALRAWQFETASALLADAAELLDRRAALESAAAAADLRLPSRLETAFESDAGFEAANAEADAEEAAIGVVAAAQAARPADPDFLQQLGLVAESPDAQLATARDAFAAGDLSQAAAEALRATSTWEGAAEIGRNRLLAAIGLGLLALLGILLVVSRWRDRRTGGAAPEVVPASVESSSAEGPASG